MTTFEGMVEVDDGYNGHKVWLALCRDPEGFVLAVHAHGWFRWEYPSRLGNRHCVNAGVK